MAVFIFDHVRAETQNELWVHMECAVWTPGICLVGSELKGLKQAVEEGRKSVSIPFLCMLIDKLCMLTSFL